MDGMGGDSVILFRWGVRCGDMEIEAPVVVNVAGPHSAQITEMALADCNDMTISTRPMRQEPGVNRSFFFECFVLLG